MPETKTGSFKIPNGNTMKAVKIGGSTGLIALIIWVITIFASPGIQDNKNDIDKINGKLDSCIEKQYEAGAEVKALIPAVKELKEDTKKIQSDISEIKGDMKVIMSKLSEN